MTTTADSKKRVVLPTAKPGDVFDVQSQGEGQFLLVRLERPSPQKRLSKCVSKNSSCAGEKSASVGGFSPAQYVLKGFLTRSKAQCLRAIAAAPLRLKMGWEELRALTREP